MPSGLTISQYSILTVLEHHGRMKVSEMAGYMVMERTTLVRSLKPLIKDSIVLSSQQIGDRARHFELSEFGKAKLKDASPLWLSAQRQFEKSVQRVRALEFRDYHLAIPDGG
ncbi:MarR family transcriptional regulator [Rhizobium sp. ZW T2_16]|uniref:MarR family transcriptional regulator n=1 Tax=Rhizobium sp. ZW T2_16 TaxID=3378083 RepID=UPI0038533B74